MKNYLMLALLIGAASTMAFGQTVTCDGCTHDVSVYMGEGGLIAETDADEVVWVTTCDGVTVSGELTPNDDGKVSMLFDDMNGLACHSDKGSLQLGPVMDGGWYWITDDMNSAVGGLVGKDIQDNEAVMITSAGDGVTMTKGKGAVYLKETATGRVGILPNILAEPPTPAPKKCGFTGSFSATSPGKPVQTGCMLGDGKAMVLATSTNAVTGSSVTIMNKGSVVRPAGTGTVSIVADVWGNGTGHYVTTHDATTLNGVCAGRGHAALAGTGLRGSARYTGVTYAVNVSEGGAGTGTDVSTGSPEAGVDYTAADSAATVTIVANTTYCSKDNNHPVTVTVTATIAADSDATQVVPEIVRKATTNVVGSTSFTVMCPSASPSKGTELVPDNPFPTE